jgi:hypothetical protein
MSETANLGLPLLMAAQAQKHVTVNEALARLDALAQIVLRSRTQALPPASARDGDAYAVPAGAGGDWAGQAGRLALRVNGGWEHVAPRTGWRGWIEDERQPAVFDGVAWAPSAIAVSEGGAALAVRVVEFDHAVGAGSQSVTAPAIPAGSIVFGVTGRVIEALGGTATSFRVGVGTGAPDRYGSGIGTGAGAWFRGVTGTPTAYYADTSLSLAAEGGAFAGGIVRLAVHLAELGLPRA